MLADQFQATSLIEPVGFEFGKAGFGRAGACDGDEKSLEVAKARSVGLHKRAKATAQEVSLVGFARATTGNESGAQGIERWIGERAEDHEAAGFGLT
jgi:hypothetical protein